MIMRSLNYAGALIVGLLLCGCNTENSALPAKPTTGEDVRRDVGKAAETTGTYLSEKQAEYTAELKQRLGGLDVKIAELKQRGKELGKDAHERWKPQLDRLEELRQETETKLESVQKASGPAWEDLKQGAESAWKKLHEAYEHASTSLEPK
jgi:hypothetical protein